MPPLAPRLALGLALVCVLHAAGAGAQRVIGPDQEERVLALFAPAGLGEEVVPGYRLMDVAIRRHDIAVRLDALTGTATQPESLAVQLGALGAPAPAGMVSLGETASFRIVAAEGLPQPQRELLEAFAARIRQNDTGSFWEETSFESSPEPRQSLGLRWMALAALLATLIATFVARRMRAPARSSEHVE